jgi:hypothetical protein
MISAAAADDRIADCTTSTPKTPNATTTLTTGYIADTKGTEKKKRPGNSERGAVRGSFTN